MAQKWNLQDIRPTPRDRERDRRTEASVPKQDIAPKKRPPFSKRRPRPDANLGSIDVEDGNARKKRRLFISILIAVVVLGAGFGMSALLGGAEVTVYPKYKDTTVEATFTAYVEPGAGELGYEILSLEANGERQVSATGEEEVSEQAQGTIFIYNAYSTSPQRLIKNTRFESPDGLIYRVEESVEVPGMTEDEEGNAVPGVITAEIFAEGTGEQYNIEPARFTIPGLNEGTEQYEKMYAESTDTFTGGFEGKRFIIEESELQTAKQALHLELRDALLTRLEEERPAGFVLYDDAVTFVYDTLPATEYGEKLATIKERARLQVPLFEEADFAKYLAQNTIAGYEGEGVIMPDPFTLSFSYPSSTVAAGDIATQTETEFTLSGDTRIVWDFDEEKLQSDLLGLSKTALPSVLSGYPAIERAEAIVRPFWAQSFPENTSEVTITAIVGEKEE